MQVRSFSSECEVQVKGSKSTWVDLANMPGFSSYLVLMSRWTQYQKEPGRNHSLGPEYTSFSYIYTGTSTTPKCIASNTPFSRHPVARIQTCSPTTCAALFKRALATYLQQQSTSSCLEKLERAPLAPERNPPLNPVPRRPVCSSPSDAFTAS